MRIARCREHFFYQAPIEGRQWWYGYWRMYWYCGMHLVEFVNHERWIIFVKPPWSKLTLLVARLLWHLPVPFCIKYEYEPRVPVEAQ